MARRKTDGGQRIIDGLNEAVAWTKGEISTAITLPGEPPRMMTRDEYEAEKERRLRLPSPPTTG